jgi:hypothetical protein
MRAWVVVASSLLLTLVASCSHREVAIDRGGWEQTAPGRKTPRCLLRIEVEQPFAWEAGKRYGFLIRGREGQVLLVTYSGIDWKAEKWQREAYLMERERRVRSWQVTPYHSDERLRISGVASLKRSWSLILGLDPPLAPGVEILQVRDKRLSSGDAYLVTCHSSNEPCRQVMVPVSVRWGYKIGAEVDESVIAAIVPGTPVLDEQGLVAAVVTRKQTREQGGKTEHVLVTEEIRDLLEPGEPERIPIGWDVPAHLLLEKRFDELEWLADSYRISGDDAKLYQLYRRRFGRISMVLQEQQQDRGRRDQAAGAIPHFTTTETYRAPLGLLEEWLDARPGSHHAKVATAAALIDMGYEYCGHRTDFAQCCLEVYQLMHEDLLRAEALLDQVAAGQNPDISYYRLRMSLALIPEYARLETIEHYQRVVAGEIEDKGPPYYGFLKPYSDQEIQGVRELFEAACRIDPTNRDLYAQMGSVLLEAFRDDLSAYERFAVEAVTRTHDLIGESMYAVLALQAEFKLGKSKAERVAAAFDEQRVRKGLEDYLCHIRVSDRYLVRLLQLACADQDRETARRWIEQLDPDASFDWYGWTRHDYQECRRWAIPH